MMTVITNYVIYILLVGLAIWLGVLSWLWYRQQSLFDSLFEDVSDPDTRKKFFKLLQEIDDVNERQQFLAKALKQLEMENLRHTQKVMMMRYNPYGEVGGEQSFSVAILDGANNGLVVTSLHSRAGTRVYAKSVTKGVADRELSKEEQEVMEQASKRGLES